MKKISISIIVIIIILLGVFYFAGKSHAPEGTENVINKSELKQ